MRWPKDAVREVSAVKIEVRRGAGLVLFEGMRRLCGNGGEERKFGGGGGVNDTRAE